MKKNIFLNGLYVIITFTLIFSTRTMAAGPLYEGYMYSSDDIAATAPFEAQKVLSRVGYDCYVYKDTSAFYVRRTMNDDAIFFYSGHADPGILKCSGNTQVSAKTVLNNNNNYSLEAAFTGTTNKLKKTRLAYYSGCNTANTSNTYGNLLTYTVATLKAGVAIGFSKSIEVNVSNWFDTTVFSYAKDGYSIETSVDKALADTKATYSTSIYNASNISSVCFVGVSSLKLTPAAYYN